MGRSHSRVLCGRVVVDKTKFFGRDQYFDGVSFLFLYLESFRWREGQASALVACDRFATAFSWPGRASATHIGKYSGDAWSR